MMALSLRTWRLYPVQHEEGHLQVLVTLSFVTFQPVSLQKFLIPAMYSIISFLSFNFMALVITGELYKAFGHRCVACHQSHVHTHLRSLTLHPMTNWELLSQILTPYEPMSVIRLHSGLYLLPLAHKSL